MSLPQAREQWQAVRPARVMGRLRLTAGKAAEVCGITRRQLCYWTDKGIIPCCNGAERGSSRRIYDAAGLCKALMLKRLIDEGRGLRRAVRELKARWVEPAADQEAEAGDEQALLAQAERLTRLGERAAKAGAAGHGREALVRLALALQPLIQLSQAASEGRITFTDGKGVRDLQSGLSEAEGALTAIR